MRDLFAEFTQATSGGGGGSGSSPDRRGAASLLASDQRRHSACAAFGGELRVPSPAFSPPQDAPPSAWQGRNLLSPSHGQCRPVVRISAAADRPSPARPRRLTTFRVG